MATQVTLGSGVVDSASGLKLRTNGSTEAVDISTGQVVTLAKDAVVNGLTVGKGAGAVSTNTAVGASALSGSVTGGNNVAIGQNTMAANTSGNTNTAIGWAALNANTTANQNTAVGSQSLYANTTGANDTAVGLNSLVANTTGGSNTAIGTQSLNANTTASNNTAVGYQALYTNSTASNSTSVGYKAGYSSTGVNNTFVGFQSGYLLGTGTNNVLVGINAGYNLSSGSKNTFIGTDGGTNDACGAAVTTGSKNTIIGGYSGNQGGLDIRTASNYIVLSDGDGNPRGIFDSSGNLLVGITSSSNKFIVSTDGVRAHFYVNSSGNVGAYSLGTGTVYSNAGILTNTNPSDSRLKTDVQDLSWGLSQILALRPVSYTWKNNPTNQGTQYGFIAQEVQTVMPELVREFETTDGEETVTRLGLEKDGIHAALVKAIQEQQALITQLQADVAALKGQA